MLSIIKIYSPFYIRYFIILSFSLSIVFYPVQANEISSTSTSKLTASQINKHRKIPIVDLPSEHSIKMTDTESYPLPQFINLTHQIATLTKFSNLIFHGQIIDVEYQMAETDAEGSYPLTYITLEIFELLQGEYESNEIVLMMQGVGWIPSGTFVTRSDLPILATGDEIILFLTEGSINGPIYLHHFFVIDGKLYDDQSNEIVSDDDNVMWQGKIVPKEKIMKRSLGVGTLHFIKEHEPVPQNSSVNNNSKQASTTDYFPLGVQAFNKGLKQAYLSVLKQQEKSSQTKKDIKIQSANKRRSMFFSSKADAARRQR